MQEGRKIVGVALRSGHHQGEVQPKQWFGHESNNRAARYGLPKDLSSGFWRGERRCIYITDFSAFTDSDITDFILEVERLNRPWKPQIPRFRLIIGLESGYEKCGFLRGRCVNSGTPVEGLLANNHVALNIWWWQGLNSGWEVTGRMVITRCQVGCRLRTGRTLANNLFHFNTCCWLGEPRYY